MQRVILMATIGLVVLAAACVPPEAPPASTTTTSTTTTTVSTTTVSTTTTVDPGACPVERETISVALVAYQVTYGQWPSTLDDLVADGWLQAPPAFDWDYGVADDGYLLAGPC